jgi:hypothetical protein
MSHRVNTYNFYPLYCGEFGFVAIMIVCIKQRCIKKDSVMATNLWSQQSHRVVCYVIVVIPLRLTSL